MYSQFTEVLRQKKAEELERFEARERSQLIKSE